VNSQQLRFIELLLHHPWTVELQADHFGSPAPKAVRVANPLGFIAQKLLIHLFGAHLEHLRKEWTGVVRSSLHARAAKTVESAHEWLFGEVSDAIRAAASIAVDRKLTPETVRASCQYGLQQIIA
jgi:hypothetical protein